MKSSKLLVWVAMAAAVVAVPFVMAQSADKGATGQAAQGTQNAPVDKAQSEAEQKAKRRAAAAAQEKAQAGQQAEPREEEEEEARRRR